jgi:chromosome segregation ATPase
MRRNILAPLALATFAALAPGLTRAADQDTEARLREALRNAITQNRSIEDERAVLLAKQAESAKEIEALRQQVEALSKQLAEQPTAPAAKKSTADNAAYERAVAEFNHRLAEQNETIGKFGETLEKWKTAYNEAANVARAKEAERVKLAAQTNILTQRATSCESENAELFKIGTEILDRYATMDISDALAAHEPFVGFKRVELQNVVQDYQDKLLDEKVAP